MAADPAQVMRILDIRGIAVRLEGDHLRAHWRGGGPIPADMAAFIRHFKPVIAGALHERARLAATVANVLALDDAGYRQWCADVRRAPPRDPHLANVRAALRDVTRRKTRERLNLERAA